MIAANLGPYSYSVPDEHRAHPIDQLPMKSWAGGHGQRNRPLGGGPPIQNNQKATVWHGLDQCLGHGEGHQQTQQAADKDGEHQGGAGADCSRLRAGTGDGAGGRAGSWTGGGDGARGEAGGGGGAAARALAGACTWAWAGACTGLR
eukprot:EG_transcript_22218